LAVSLFISTWYITIKVCTINHPSMTSFSNHHLSANFYPDAKGNDGMSGINSQHQSFYASSSTLPTPPSAGSAPPSCHPHQQQYSHQPSGLYSTPTSTSYYQPSASILPESASYRENGPPLVASIPSSSHPAPFSTSYYPSIHSYPTHQQQQQQQQQKRLPPPLYSTSGVVVVPHHGSSNDAGMHHLRTVSVDTMELSMQDDDTSSTSSSVSSAHGTPSSAAVAVNASASYPEYGMTTTSGRNRRCSLPPRPKSYSQDDVAGNVQTTMRTTNVRPKQQQQQQQRRYRSSSTSDAGTSRPPESTATDTHSSRRRCSSSNSNSSGEERRRQGCASPQRPPPSSSLSSSSASSPSQVLSDAIHPHRYKMKTERREKTAMAMVGGAVVGSVVFPVVGTVVGGVAAAYAANQLAKNQAKRAQREWERCNFQKQADASAVGDAEYV
jgi:hypothetical protein